MIRKIIILSLITLVTNNHLNAQGGLPFRSLLPVLDYHTVDSTCERWFLFKNSEERYNDDSTYAERYYTGEKQYDIDSCTYPALFAMTECEKLDYLDSIVEIYYFDKSNLLYYQNKEYESLNQSLFGHEKSICLIPSFINFREYKIVYDLMQKYGKGPYSGCRVIGFVDHPFRGECTILSEYSDGYYRWSAIEYYEAVESGKSDNATLYILNRPRRAREQLNYWRKMAGCPPSSLVIDREPYGDYTNVAEYATQEEEILLEMLQNELILSLKNYGRFRSQRAEMRSFYLSIMQGIIRRQYNLPLFNAPIYYNFMRIER